LKGLIRLIDIGLDFEGCTRITKEGLDYISRGLKGIKSLRGISFDFCQCNQITVKDREKFMAQLESIGRQEINVRWKQDF